MMDPVGNKVFCSVQAGSNFALITLLLRHRMQRIEEGGLAPCQFDYADKIMLKT
jgi:hypothetical protein